MSTMEIEKRPRSRALAYVLVGLAGLAAGVFLGEWAFRRAAWSSGVPQLPSAATTAPAAEMIVRRGATIFVPEGSPYRNVIEIAPALAETERASRSFPANVEADATKTVAILPPLSGKIVDLNVRLGDAVVKGQPLATIDSGDLAQAVADDEKARAALDLARRARERAKGLSQFGGEARKDLEQAESDFAQAQAEFNRTQARLQELGSAGARASGGLLTIASPTDGIVTAISAAKGAVLNDVTASIMTISDLSDVWVAANVSEEDLAFVSKGQSVEVTFPAYPGEVFHGKIDTVGEVLDPDTRREKIRIVFENQDGRLKPNMFATVTCSAAPTKMVMAPTSALLMNNDATSVFVETAPWTFERRVVEPAAETDGKAPIRRGLEAGERIVVRGGVLLND